MKVLSIIVLKSLLFFSTTSVNAQDQVRLEIYSCTTSVLTIFDGSNLLYPNPQFDPQGNADYVFAVKLTQEELGRVNSAITEFISSEQRLILDNYCIPDGSMYKLKFFQKNRLLRTVILRNYYDPNLSAILNIVSKYFKLQSTAFTLEDFADLEGKEACFREYGATEIERKIKATCPH